MWNFRTNLPSFNLPCICQFLDHSFLLFLTHKKVSYLLHLSTAAAAASSNTHIYAYMEPYSWPENLTSYRKRAIEELIRGREFTNQLQSMLTKTVKGEEGSMFPEDLVMKILGSFTETLSILKSTDSDEVSQFPAGLGCRKYEDSGESSKTSVKDRRGCYKRRYI